MAVVARFYCASITTTKWNPTSEQTEVTLQASTRGTENKAWAAATPAGQIKMTVNNETAGQWFRDRIGKDIAITFEDAPEPAE